MKYLLKPQHTTPLRGPEAERYLEETLGHSIDVLNRFPKYFLIEPVNTCNARCVMCGIDFDSKQAATMSDALFDKIADEIATYGDHVEKVMLYLDSEPLMDRHLHDKVRRLKAAGVKRVNIATNGSLLTERRSRELLEAGLDEAYISIDSLKKEVFEAIRLRLKFEHVYDNTINFIRLRDEINPAAKVRMQMILQEQNLDEADAFVEHWASRLGPQDQIAVQRGHNWASAIQIMKFGDEEAINNIPCIALWGTFCIHVHGEVGLCCMDTSTKIQLGNVATQSIAEVWSGEPMREIRDKHVAGLRSEIPLCNGCTLWRESKRDLRQMVGAD